MKGLGDVNLSWDYNAYMIWGHVYNDFVKKKTRHILCMNTTPQEPTLYFEQICQSHHNTCLFGVLSLRQALSYAPIKKSDPLRPSNLIM